MTGDGVDDRAVKAVAGCRDAVDLIVTFKGPPAAILCGCPAAKPTDNQELSGLPK